MDVFSPASQIYPFGRRGGIAATEAVQMDNKTDFRRLSWQATPLVLEIRLGGRKSDVQTDFSFVESKAGHTAFKMKDPWAYSILDEAVGTGNASRTIWYLDYKFIDGTKLTVYLDSIAPSDQPTLSDELGKITFSSAPGASVVISADYEYYRKFYFELKDPEKDLDIRKQGPDFWTFNLKLKESLL